LATPTVQVALGFDSESSEAVDIEGTKDDPSCKKQSAQKRRRTSPGEGITQDYVPFSKEVASNDSDRKVNVTADPSQSNDKATIKSLEDELSQWKETGRKLYDLCVEHGIGQLKSGGEKGASAKK